MASDPVELYEQFFEVAGRGDEAAAKKFLIDNLKQFPEETQDAIIAAFFEEALTKKAHEAEAISEFQKQGVKTVNVLEQAKQDLQKKLELLKAKNSI